MSDMLDKQKVLTFLLARMKGKSDECVAELFTLKTLIEQGYFYAEPATKPCPACGGKGWTAGSFPHGDCCLGCDEECDLCAEKVKEWCPSCRGTGGV